MQSGLLVGLIFGAPSGLINGLVNGLVVGLLNALIVGLLLGLFIGLGDVYKHFLLHGFLHQQGLLSFRTVKFLNYARERRLLRQVGGGFIFIHRYVLDYFDDEFKARYLKKNAGG